MKRMQCEVCGSNEIQKVADGIFECQSCGVRYSISDVKKLLVEIDHTSEAVNYIKRGESFENEGDSEKAREYYNKALDLYVDNREAEEGLKRISDAQQFDDCYIIKCNVDPKDSISNFLKKLSAIENIACDIYKEIGIKSVSEKYYPFALIKGKYRCNWSLTACHKYYENQTVYKEEYDYTLKRHVTRPQTQKIERIERTPMNGSRVYEASKLILASRSILDNVTIDQQNLIEAFMRDFEEIQNEGYSSYKSIPIQIGSLEKKNDVYEFSDIPLDIKVDSDICRSRKADLRKEAGDRVAKEIMSGIECDFCEGISATSEVLSETVTYIYLPVQTIEYTYKSQNYYAVFDLIDSNAKSTIIYPQDVVIFNLKKECEEKGKSPFVKDSKALIVNGILFFAVAALGSVFSIFKGDITILFCFGVPFLIPAIFFLAFGFRKKKKLSASIQDTEKILEKTLEPRLSTLRRDCQVFMESYLKNHSISLAQKGLNNNDDPVSITRYGIYPLENLCFNETSFDEKTNTESRFKVAHYDYYKGRERILGEILDGSVSVNDRITINETPYTVSEIFSNGKQISVATIGMTVLLIINTDKKIKIPKESIISTAK